MKLATFIRNSTTETYWGFYLNGKLYPVNHMDFPDTLLAALNDWNLWYPALRLIEGKIEKTGFDGISFAENEIVYLPVIPNPPSFRDFYAFEQHVKSARQLRKLEMIPEWYEIPVFYFSNHRNFIGDGVPLVKPAQTEELDFELEIGCVISKLGRNISPDVARSFIAGYTIINDWSARDIQRQEMRVGLGPAKGKDFATGMGPFLVTPDSLMQLQTEKSHNLEMRAYKNGVLISKGNFSDITYSFSDMIARASENTTLYPGDILGSGTVGTGCILELRPENTDGWLKSGDTMRLEIDELGSLENKIIE